jgi:hypothetical protein
MSKQPAAGKAGGPSAALEVHNLRNPKTEAFERVQAAKNFVDDVTQQGHRKLHETTVQERIAAVLELAKQPGEGMHWLIAGVCWSPGKY